MQSRQVLKYPAIFRSLKTFSIDIKIAHSIFALPFAASAFVVDALPLPSFNQLFFLILAMVGARSFAMGMNRLVDRNIDAANPRTQSRKIPIGEMSAREGLIWTLLAAVLFLISAFSLNQVSGWCGIPILLILGLYPYWKRFSVLTHWYLGACLGLAPVAVSVAMEGRISFPVVVLGTAVMFWTAGFDILYALSDLSFDQQNKLKSIPAKLGARPAIYVSRISFSLMAICLALVGSMRNFGAIYFSGVVVIVFFLIYEHFLIREAVHDGKSSKLNIAFFNVNAYVSIFYFSICVLERWLNS